MINQQKWILTSDEQLVLLINSRACRCTDNIVLSGYRSAIYHSIETERSHRPALSLSVTETRKTETVLCVTVGQYVQYH